MFVETGIPEGRHMSISNIFLLFIIYSAAGWILEVIYCSIVSRRFINRGFLKGPLCPIYGVGGILVIFALKPLSENILILFVVAGIATSCLEYVTSWVLEFLFCTKWWDYSLNRFNVHGRVCLFNTIVFGVISVIVVRVMDPMIRTVLDGVPPRPLELITLSLFAVITVDFISTLITLSMLDKTVLDLKSFTKDLYANTGDISWFDPYRLDVSLVRLRRLSKSEISDTNTELLERFEKVLTHSRGMQRIFSSFPAMQNKKHNFSFDSFTRIEKPNDNYIETIETIESANIS